MPTPLPHPDRTDLTRPDADEVRLIMRGLVSASSGPHGLTSLQASVLDAVTRSLTGHRIDPLTVEPIDPAEYAAGLAARNEAFRTRLVQVMELSQMILPRPDPAIAATVETFATELSVELASVRLARQVAEGSRALVAQDFDRNAYFRSIADDATRAIHVVADIDDAWSGEVVDDALAADWEGLAELAPTTLGRKVHDFYRARGFSFPGRPGAAPPLLAQHDWVHVLADYGTTVESELEVFGFIARASDDPEAFTLLAMVVHLFETALVDRAAGIFEAAPGHLSGRGVPERLGDAMRRGALCEGSVDFLAIDWFAHAEQTPEQLRDELNLVPKDPVAVAAGSVGPWEPGGISPFQIDAGRRRAAEQGRSYDSFGATPT